MGWGALTRRDLSSTRVLTSMMMLLRGRGIAGGCHVGERFGFKLGSAILGAEIVNMSVISSGLGLCSLHAHVTDRIDIPVGGRRQWSGTRGPIVPIGARVGAMKPMSDAVR